METKNNTIKITVQDMAHVHSMATKFAADLSIESYFNHDVQQLMSYAWTNSVISLLNAKGMLQLEVKVAKGYDDAD